METGSGLLADRLIGAVDLRLIDDEIVVTGNHVNKTYLAGQGDAGNKTTIDGRIWHRTGDAGRLDGDGSLWLRGRISGRCGTVYPFEVEAPSRLWPGVKRSALAVIDGRPVLAVEGNQAYALAWQKAAASIGVDRVIPVAAMPLDRRHHSKVDHKSLERLLRGSIHRA